MANKDKKPGLTGGDILLAVLLALIGGISAFLVILIGGSLLAPDFGKSQTADQPPAVSQPVRGTLPSSAPVFTHTPKPTDPPVEPSDEPEPEQTVEPEQQTVEPTAPPSQPPEPAQTQAPTPTQSRAPAQNPDPVISINPTTPPAVPTQAPAQPNRGTTSNGDGTYTHDFSGGRVLITTQSNNNNDPVYHTRDCRSAKIIPPENEFWYASAQAAESANRRLCGNCAR